MPARGGKPDTDGRTGCDEPCKESGTCQSKGNRAWPGASRLLVRAVSDLVPDQQDVVDISSAGSVLLVSSGTTMSFPPEIALRARVPTTVSPHNGSVRGTSLRELSSHSVFEGALHTIDRFRHRRYGVIGRRLNAIHRSVDDFLNLCSGSVDNFLNVVDGSFHFLCHVPNCLSFRRPDNCDRRDHREEEDSEPTTEVSAPHIRLRWFMFANGSHADPCS
ncbi:MAG: hypothetical protein ACLGHL_06730 [Actinomycetota bacterium]